MHNLIKYLILQLLLFISAVLYGQEIKVIKDFRFNGSVGVEKELFDVLEIGFENSIKLEKNASEIDEVDFDLRLKYSPFGFFSFGLGYRLAANHKKSGNYAWDQRFNADLEFAVKLARFRAGYRIRYQNIDDDFFLYDENTPPQHILRNKLEIRYNIRNCKLSPFIYSEFYGNLNETDEFAFRIKYAVGGRYSFGKYGKFKAYYRIIRQLNDLYPYTYYNLGIGYVYDF